MSEFVVKDSGARHQFESGMLRDSQKNDKTDWELILVGPMARRWAEHLTKGAKKYPDPALGVPNWTLASGLAEYVHARKSLSHHYFDYLYGERSEDHCSAIFFNVNLMEYLRERIFIETGAYPEALIP